MPKTIKLDIPESAAERELVRLTRENARLRFALERIAEGAIAQKSARAALAGESEDEIREAGTFRFR